MKKLVIYISVLVILICSLCGHAYIDNVKNNDLIDSISNKIIRFHVLANSNSNEDQQLKIKVKDKIIEYIFPKLENSNSLEESREILANNEDEIIKIANECINENGYNYSVKVEFKRENFPEKVYGNISLPQGEYEAFRVLIGEASGENWWCVMFPPLCFVDETKGDVDSSNLKEVLVDDNDEENNIKCKFKIVELIKDILKNN